MERILKKFPSLRSYFASEESTDQRFQRLSQVFDNSLLEPALLFQTSSISLFTTFNLLLQRDYPGSEASNRDPWQKNRKSYYLAKCYERYRFDS